MFKSKHTDVFVWSCQSPKLNVTENLQQDSEMLLTGTPLNTELAKMLIFRCATLMETCLKITQL